MGSISNESIVKWAIAPGPSQARKIDHAIVLDASRLFTGGPSESLHTPNIEKLKVEKNGVSIDQTAAGWVHFRPIGIHVETKKGAVGEDEPHVHLSTQQRALHSRPRQLLPGKAKTILPSLAVLSIQGQRYPFLAYTTTGGLVSPKSYTTGGHTFCYRCVPGRCCDSKGCSIAHGRV